MIESVISKFWAEPPPIKTLLGPLNKILDPYLAFPVFLKIVAAIELHCLCQFVGSLRTSNIGGSCFVRTNNTK